MAMHPSPNLLARFAPFSPVSECPRVLAQQTGDVFALWQAWEEECGAVRDVPYWAIVWPAARVLGAYLVAHPQLVQGRSVLDCGCGGGVVAIAAAQNGAARVMGCDLDPTAVVIAHGNAAANQVEVDFLCQDVVACCGGERFDLILVADLFYQKEFSLSLLTALVEAQGRGSTIIIADSGRPFLPKEGLREIHAQQAATSFAVEGCLTRTVRLYHLAEERAAVSASR
jgi:predicted nicotinamide N-methyase